MRVLILHSDIAPDAGIDDQDTLIQSRAIAAALEANGHSAELAPFRPDPGAVAMRVRKADVVFNMVETVWGRGLYAPLGAAILEGCGVRFTGGSAAALAASSNKLIAKDMMARAGLPTAPWSEGPEWRGLDGGRWIVKAADEDASIGLDDAAVCEASQVKARAEDCARRLGRHWFAEKYIAGREFTLSMAGDAADPRVFAIAEILFENWQDERPKIVGFVAKWEKDAEDYANTPRSFHWKDDSGLRAKLESIARAAWKLFGLCGYARIDFRVDEKGSPFILEVNANASLAPGDELPEAALESGIAYNDLVEMIVKAAHV